MLPHLDDAPTLAARTRRTTVLACALTAAVLAPCVDLFLFQGAMSSGLDPELDAIIAYVLWAPVMAGALGGLVPHLAFRASPAYRGIATIGLAAVAGVLQLGLLLLATLPGMVVERGVGGLDVLGVAAMIGTFGSIVSAPMGAGFGLLFLVTAWPAIRSMEAPSQDGPAWVSCAAGVQLAVASFIALALLHAAEGPYCQALFVVALPSLGVHLPDGSDVAWTRYLLAGPLVIGALLVLARGLWLELVLWRCARALQRDVHPRWRKTTTEASLETVVPLRTRDRARRLLEVVAREEVAPYRGTTAAITAISEDV
jgi:hypothetical protein